MEIVRRFYDAWNRRDEEALLALVDPEVEYVNSPTAIEPGTRHGTNEVLPSSEHNGSSCAMAGPRSIEPTIAGRRSSSWHRVSRLMPEGETRIEDRVLASVVLRDGKIVRVEVLGFGGAEVDRALEAAGLSE